MSCLHTEVPYLGYKYTKVNSSPSLVFLTLNRKKGRLKVSLYPLFIRRNLNSDKFETSTSRSLVWLMLFNYWKMLVGFKLRNIKRDFY